MGCVATRIKCAIDLGVHGLGLLVFDLGGFIVSLTVALSTLTWWGVPSAVAAPTLMLAQVDTAQATIISTSDPANVLGEALFRETENGLRISVSLSDAPPGDHGFHIHENGSCADGGQAAGGHYNPLDVKHGYLPADGLDDAHAGDLGNIYISITGRGVLETTVAGVSLTGGEPAVDGRAVILHAERDDFGQPTGNAGGRIGCGLIE